MKQMEETQQHQSLYLEVCSQNKDPRLPLHTSIALFLLSYCKCKSFKVYLVSTQSTRTQSLKSQIPEFLDVSETQAELLPQLVRGCRLPVVLDETGRLCRAGLAVVLRHIINKTLEIGPLRNDVQALLGFKKTCLKACAEVSGTTPIHKTMCLMLQLHFQDAREYSFQYVCSKTCKIFSLVFYILRVSILYPCISHWACGHRNIHSANLIFKETSQFY